MPSWVQVRGGMGSSRAEIDMHRVNSVLMFLRTLCVRGNQHKMLAVKRADGVVAALCLVACVLVPDVAGCSGNLSVSGWQLPSDKSAIVSEMPAKPYKAHGLPDGTVSVWTKYRPGFRFRRPDGNGFWEFRDASKISYNGRVFAIVATAY